MIFRPKGKKKQWPTIHINGSSILDVDNAKFLGVILDNKLNWFENIKCISRIIAKGTGIIIKARKSFESETLLNLYNALILPHISYCVHSWGTMASINLQRLYVLQKIVRIICGVHPRTHTEPLYKALHILNVEQIRDYSITLFIYQYTKIERLNAIMISSHTLSYCLSLFCFYFSHYYLHYLFCYLHNCVFICIFAVF